MSAAQSETAVTRVAAKRKELGAEDFGAYAFLVLGMLAHQAPEVVEFVLDRADAFLSTPPAVRCDGSGRCPAPLHVHGCYADRDGTACDDPGDHPTSPGTTAGGDDR